MTNLSEELHGKAKLAFEAFKKMIEGEKMYKEGYFELNNLFGEHSKKSNETKPTDPDEALLKKKIGLSTPGFRRDKRPDDVIREKIIETLRAKDRLSTVELMTRLKLSRKRAFRIISQLESDGVIEDQGGGIRHEWSLVRKEVNDHQLKKTPGGGTPRRGRVSIDITNEEFVEKAMKFLKTHDWVTRGQLIEAVDLSRKPGNRLIEYLMKEHMIKQVYKKNNPAHKKAKALYVQSLPYLEAAA